jgi:hypothetical protein
MDDQHKSPEKKDEKSKCPLPVQKWANGDEWVETDKV